MQKVSPKAIVNVLLLCILALLPFVWNGKGKPRIDYIIAVSLATLVLGIMKYVLHKRAGEPIGRHIALTIMAFAIFTLLILCVGYIYYLRSRAYACPEG
ncbi:hypothetical protein ACLI09_06190 [Flavobacterium sp. RHBU_24]|uniref:hypothetical protein n=1 Tax=Flavobacterium sp. RHBU_24 TaxID=3391185 RepID=UPI0039850F94